MMETKRKILPPVYLLFSLVAMTAMHFWWPIQRFLEVPYTFIGAALVLVGIIGAASGARLFAAAGTPVVPFERSTALVTHGLYRYSRNPMYLSLVLVLLGAGILFGTVGALLPIPAFVWVIQVNFIRGEERFLEALFGDAYRAYKQRVRRWI